MPTNLEVKKNLILALCETHALMTLMTDLKAKHSNQFNKLGDMIDTLNSYNLRLERHKITFNYIDNSYFTFGKEKKMADLAMRISYIREGVTSLYSIIDNQLEAIIAEQKKKIEYALGEASIYKSNLKKLE
jgi:hypothetical protein